MKISLMVEGQAGLDWGVWKEVVAHVDDWHLAGLYTSDHFVNPSPRNTDALEMIVAHSYTAAHTQHVTFGPIVAPMTFRDPRLLARQAAALDVLSNGRMILGVGAGWMQREHDMFGYALGDVATRMARFEEGVQVIDALLHSSTPVNFHGSHFNLRDAEIRPRTGKTRIMVGGNGKERTMRLAAKYANVWNGVALSPAEFHERTTLLDEYAHAAGRAPQEIARTTCCVFFSGETDAELEQRVRTMRWRNDSFAEMPLDTLCAKLRESNMIVGNASEVLDKFRAYAAAGVQELMLQWFEPQDVEGIFTLANRILPQFEQE